MGERVTIELGAIIRWRSRKMSQPMTPAENGAPKKAVTSTLANDPDMAELVAEFAREMPLRAAELTRCWEKEQLEDIRRLAHQLKGASGGYGFVGLGRAASNVESLLVKLGNGDTEATMERLRAEFYELVDIVKRVTV